MDRQYIRTTVESYLIDKGLEEELLEENYNLIVDNIDYMKENYECAYVQMHNMNRVEQQRYIYNFLDTKDELLEENEFLTTATVVALAAALGVVILDKHGHKVLKIAHRTMMDRWIRFHKFIEHKKWFKEHKVVNKILSSNYADCRRKAGLPEIGDDSAIATAMRPSKIFGLTPRVSLDEHQKAEALRDCYIDYIISVIASMSVIYVKCLEDSGEIKQQVSTDHGMGALLNYPTGEGCQVLYDQLKEQHDDFVDVLDVFFKDERRERMEWIKRLDEKVRGAKRGEHLRPSNPSRHKGAIQRDRYISGKDRGFKGNKNVDPTGPMYRR